MLICFLFYANLFFPTLKLIATPELEISDAIHLSYASKYWYSQKLRAGDLPIWSGTIGSGFPVLGEGQTGIFFFPNLVLYRFFAPPLAYNLSLVLVSITLALGMYWWGILLGYSAVPTLLGSLTLALSGFVLFHLQHIALLQSFSIAPAIMAATYGIWRYKKWFHGALLAFLLSQQLFAGFAQAWIMTLGFSALYFLLLTGRPKNIRHAYTMYAAAVLVGIGMSAIQLLPSVEFLQNLVVSGGETLANATKFSFPVEQLATFVTPFPFGNPQVGTYFSLAKNHLGLFWENNGYVGLVPLVTLFFALSVKKLRQQIVPYLVILSVSGILMLGQYSPLYFLFGFWPLNLFRAPSRFIFFVLLLLIMISIHTGSFLWTASGKLRRVFLMLLMAGNLLFFISFWYTYHLLVDAKTVSDKPPILADLSPGSRIFHIAASAGHRELFYANGWTDPSRFDIFKNSLEPNSNFFWNIKTIDAYPSRLLRRNAYMGSLIRHELDTDGPYATMSAYGKKLVTIMGTSAIIAGKQFDDPAPFEKTKIYKSRDALITLYTNPVAIPSWYLSNHLINAHTLEEASKQLQESSFIPGKSALVEKNIAGVSSAPDGEQPTAMITPFRISDRRLGFRINGLSRQSLLVITHTFYPGWTAIIDGRHIDIVPVNLIHQGIVVPAGNHTVELFYAPTSLAWGIAVTILSVCGVVAGFFLEKKSTA